MKAMAKDKKVNIAVTYALYSRRQLVQNETSKVPQILCANIVFFNEIVPKALVYNSIFDFC
jgi:hypothetical protein